MSFWKRFIGFPVFVHAELKMELTFPFEGLLNAEEMSESIIIKKKGLEYVD